MAVDGVINEMPPIVLEMLAKQWLQIRDVIAQLRCLAYEIRPRLGQIRLFKGKARVVNGIAVSIQQECDAARLDSRSRGQFGKETVDDSELRRCHALGGRRSRSTGLRLTECKG